MTKDKKLRICEILTSAGAIVFFVGFLSDILPLWIGGLVLLAAGSILYIRICRCPCCGKYLRGISSASSETTCRHCGSKISLKD